MQTTKFSTGRTYNGEQVLVIEAPSADEVSSPDAHLHDYTATFTDLSRGIAGTVTVYSWDLLSPFDLQRAVLREYDAGRYTALTVCHNTM